jgi:C_GCAxxG_C_C family probable redox protein
MSNVEKAVDRFTEGFSCAQAILSTFAPGLGLDEETALKLASGFGGGMGRMGKTCGAVTGAFMAIGLKYGKTKADDEESKERTYMLACEFAKRFESNNGSVTCNDLLGCDIATPEGMRRAEAEDLFNTLCPKLVRNAAEILEGLL